MGQTLTVRLGYLSHLLMSPDGGSDPNQSKESFSTALGSWLMCPAIVTVTPEISFPEAAGSAQFLEGRAVPPQSVCSRLGASWHLDRAPRRCCPC